MSSRARGDRTARTLRAVTGTDEALLDRVPTERARYTSLGALIVCTALVGTVSMWVGLRQVSDAGWLLAVALVVPALMWGVVVLVIDRALITSSGGSAWWTRLPALVVRFVLAGAIGLVIAEPLVLQLFHSAIEQEINDRRDGEADALRDRLIRCNPVPPAQVPTDVDCRGAALDPGQTVGGAVSRLAALRMDEATLREQATVERDEQARLEELARRECAGEAGDGLTGRRGVGPLCRQARDVVAQYEADHPAAALQQRLTAIRNEINELGGVVAGRTDTFEESRNAVIAQRVAELRDNQGGIGLLERFASLDRLTGAESGLRLREWFIRIVLVLIDCLPVLVKFIGGATSYDRIVDGELRTARLVHEAEVDVRKTREVDRLRTAGRIDREQNEAELRRVRAAALAQEDQEIEDRRRQYLRMSEHSPGSGRPTNGVPQGDVLHERL